MKTPISYYGGKQMMLPHILPLIPKHDVYTEPFAGGLAVFFAKEPVRVEVINDLNGEVVNFYQVLQLQFDELASLIQTTLHSRKQHKQAFAIYSNPEFFSPVQRAWAFWVLTNEGFATKIGTSWGYDKSSNSVAKKVHNAKCRFRTDEYRERLELTQIECNDAVRIIESRDRAEAFHYVDPPYFNSNCGHYKGYTEADFVQLLECLAKVKGKFLLSSYPSAVLAEWTSRMGWHQLEFKKSVAVSKQAAGTKVEVLTSNYPISK